MTAVVRDQLAHLAGVLAALRARVRAAVAGEVARAVAAAVRQVVHAVAAGRGTPARPARPDRWAGEYDPYDVDVEADVEADTDDPHAFAGRGPVAAPSAAATVAAAAGLARWWLARRGSLPAAAGLGVAVGLVGLFGGPAARAAVAVLAAVAELLTATDDPPG